MSKEDVKREVIRMLRKFGLHPSQNEAVSNDRSRCIFFRQLMQCKIADDRQVYVDESVYGFNSLMYNILQTQVIDGAMYLVKVLYSSGYNV